MNKIKIGLLSVALSASVYGENVDIGTGFLGIEVGNTELQGARYMNIYDGNTYNPFYEGSGIEIGIKLGAQNEEWRTSFVIDYYDNEDEDQNYEKAMIMIDYFLINAYESEMSVRPYIGANLGYMGYESTFIDESDFVYGGQAGLVVNVSSVDVDLSYRYSLFNGDTADTMGSIMLGVNYLY